MKAMRRTFTRENVGSAFRKLGALRVKVSHATLLEIALLTLILTMAFTIRLLPIRWGYYLSEFDPYYQYRITKHVAEQGIFSFTTWHDDMSWWPFGRDVPHTSFPGLGITAAAFYTVLNGLGVPMAPLSSLNPLSADPIYNFVIIFPVIMATLTCLAIYFLAKDIGGKETGLFAAFFLAVNSSYIMRTGLGFFDDESVGVMGIILISLFFLRGIEVKRPWKQSLVYGIAGGLALGWLFASWGASRYMVGLLLILVLAMLMLRRYSPNLLITYSSTFGVGLLIAINVPYLGIRFLREITSLVVFGMLTVLVAFEITRRLKTGKIRIIFNVGLFSVLIVSFIALSWFGYIGRLDAKFVSVINPFERLLFPIVESVQEHRPAAWGSFYFDLGLGIFFIPVGLYFAAQNPTNRNVYLILFGLTSIYFASSMVRLTLIMAPALSILWGLALIRILRPFITVLKETPATVKQKMRFGAHVGREFSAAFLILIFLLFTFNFVFPSSESRARGNSWPRVIEQAYLPTTIASGGIGIRPNEPITDWIDALAWIRNTEGVQVVLSWWDYGYWITTVGEKPSIADNATFNWTQIANIGRVFMSNETQALSIIKDWNSQAQNMGKPGRITHVLVFTTFDYQGIDLKFGDETKWVWMARIAGLDDTKYGEITASGQNVNWTDPGRSTLIYKLMTYAKSQRIGTVEAPTIDSSFVPAYFSNMNREELWNQGGLNTVVAIYEVKYES